MLRFCLLLLGIAGTCTAFSPTFLIYCLLRFLSGVAISVIISNSFLLSKSTFWILDILQTFAFALEILLLCKAKSSCLCFLSVLEWTLPQFQAMGVILVTSAGSIGQIALGGLAFFIREWHILQMVFSVPFLIFFLSSRYTPVHFLYQRMWRCKVQAIHVEFVYM